MFTVSKTVSDETLNCIITIESAGKVYAKAATSTALGLGQFLDATWLGVVRENKPELFKKNSRAAILKMRTDPTLAIEMLARFTEDNQRIVGMNCTGGDLYLAHFLGAGAAQHVFHAPAGAAVEPLVGEDAVQANPSILRGKTCGQVRAWAAQKMLKARGHAWVEKYYATPVDQDPEPKEPPTETVEEIPDTQTLPATTEDSPAAEATADDTKVITGKLPKLEETDESWGDWAMKLIKSKTQWAATAAGGLSLTGMSGWLQDPRAYIVIGVAIVCATIIIVVERGRRP